MTFPNSYEQSSQPDVTSELAERVTSRRMVAELKLAKINTSFRTEEGYTNDTPLTLGFVKGVKSYLADPSVDLMTCWPPRTWIRKPGLQDAVEHFRFNTGHEVDTLLAGDKVFSAIEQGLLQVSSHLPSSRKELSDWRAVLKSCHRLRTDELFHEGAGALEPDLAVQDEQWAAIIIKLDESRPDGI